MGRKKGAFARKEQTPGSQKEPDPNPTQDNDITTIMFVYESSTSHSWVELEYHFRVYVMDMNGGKQRD